MKAAATRLDCLPHCLRLQGRSQGAALARGITAWYWTDYESKPLCVTEQGFSLHEAVRCHANERLKLKRLCRWRSEALNVKSQTINAILQPKYSGCECGCAECELEPIDGDFQRYFCAK
jgi:hypothetical protein